MPRIYRKIDNLPYLQHGTLMKSMAIVRDFQYGITSTKEYSLKLLLYDETIEGEGIICMIFNKKQELLPKVDEEHCIIALQYVEVEQFGVKSMLVACKHNFSWMIISGESGDDAKIIPSEKHSMFGDKEKELYDQLVQFKKQLKIEKEELVTLSALPLNNKGVSLRVQLIGGYRFRDMLSNDIIIVWDGTVPQYTTGAPTYSNSDIKETFMNNVLMRRAKGRMVAIKISNENLNLKLIQPGAFIRLFGVRCIDVTHNLIILSADSFIPTVSLSMFQRDQKSKICISHDIEGNQLLQSRIDECQLVTMHQKRSNQCQLTTTISPYPVNTISELKQSRGIGVDLQCYASVEYYTPNSTERIKRFFLQCSDTRLGIDDDNDIDPLFKENKFIGLTLRLKDDTGAIDVLLTGKAAQYFFSDYLAGIRNKRDIDSRCNAIDQCMKRLVRESSKNPTLFRFHLHHGKCDGVLRSTYVMAGTKVVLPESPAEKKTKYTND